MKSHAGRGEGGTGAGAVASEGAAAGPVADEGASAGAGAGAPLPSF